MRGNMWRFQASCDVSHPFCKECIRVKCNVNIITLICREFIQCRHSCRTLYVISKICGMHLLTNNLIFSCSRCWQRGLITSHLDIKHLNVQIETMVIPLWHLTLFNIFDHKGGVNVTSRGGCLSCSRALAQPLPAAISFHLKWDSKDTRR